MFTATPILYIYICYNYNYAFGWNWYDKFCYDEDGLEENWKTVKP